MPGPNRRSKRLKQSTELNDISQFSSVNPTDGDILIYDSTDGLYENKKTLTGNYAFTGNQTITGSLAVSDDITITDSLTVSGNTNLDSALSVTGAASLNSSLAVGTTLSVTGAATLSDNLTVAGATQVSGFSVSGAATFASTVGITGLLTASGGISTPTLSGVTALSVTDLTATDIVATNANATNLGGAIMAITGDGDVAGELTAGTLAIGQVTHAYSAGAYTVTNARTSGTAAWSLLTSADVATTVLSLSADAENSMAANVTGLVMPSGTTAQRNGTPVEGTVRYNSTDLTIEAYVNSTWADLAGGIANIVEDTTPQLGGSLDVNGQKIVSVSNGDIDIEPNGTGNVLLGNFTFDADQTVGAGQDNYVLTYDNSTGLISLEAASGGGSSLSNFQDDGSAAEMLWDGTDPVLESISAQGVQVASTTTNPQIRFNSNATDLRGIVYYDDSNNQMVMDARETTDSGIRLSHTGSSTLQTALDSDGTSLYGYYDGDVAWETYASGLQIHRPGGGIPVLNMRADTATGDSAINFAQTTNAVAQLRYHDSGYFHVQVSNTGEDVHITNLADGDMAVFNGGGSVDLYYDGVLVFATDVAGARIIDDDGDDPRLRWFQDDNTTQMANIQAQTASARLLISSDLPGNVFYVRARNGADSAYHDVIIADPDGDTALYHGGETNPSVVTVSSGLDIYDADGSGGATDAPFFGFRNADGSTRYAFMQVNANSDYWRFIGEHNQLHFIFQSHDASGVDAVMAEMDPEGEVDLYYDASKVFSTRSNGIDILGSSATSAVLSIRDNSDNAMARIGFASGSKLQIYNQKDGENVIIYADNAGGTITTGFEFDPDVGVSFNGSTPYAAPTYTVTNDVTDRTYDANSTTVAELADVLGTLIADLQSYGLLN